MSAEKRLARFMDLNSAPFPEVDDPVDRMEMWIILMDGDLSMTTDALKEIYDALPAEHSCGPGVCLICLARNAALKACPGWRNDAA